MVRSELVQLVAKNHPNLEVEEIKAIVDCIFDDVQETLKRGDRVELRGFGSFSVKRREARVARNPRNEERVFVSEKNVIHFKLGKQMFNRMNDN